MYSPSQITRKDRMDVKILGLEIALECEQAVVAALSKYREEFDNAERPRTPALYRRVRQLLDSEKIVRDLQQEIADLKEMNEQTS